MSRAPRVPPSVCGGYHKNFNRGKISCRKFNNYPSSNKESDPVQNFERIEENKTIPDNGCRKVGIAYNHSNDQMHNGHSSSESSAHTPQPSNPKGGGQKKWDKKTKGSLPKRPRDERREVKKSAVVIRLDCSLEFDNQCDSIIGQVSVTNEQRTKFNIIEDEVRKCFSDLNAETVVFGSLYTGMAFKNSDIDIYLKFPDNAAPDLTAIEKQCAQLYKTRLFHRVTKIFLARVPIIKAINYRTNMNVDISFTIPYGTVNSRLIRFLCSYDLRVKRMLFIILYWAKLQGVVSVRCMSSFTLMLLVIFYLQVVRILPPLHRVLTKGKGHSWPACLNEDVTLLHNSNRDSLHTLFLGFFSFYSAVHFNEVVISTFAGELILSAFFQSVDRLPKIFIPFKDNFEMTDKSKVSGGLLEVSVMTVQEPITLSYNTTKHLHERDVEMFKFSCISVCEVLCKVNIHDCLLTCFSEYCKPVLEDSIFKWTMACPNTMNHSDWLERVYTACLSVFDRILLMTTVPQLRSIDYHDYQVLIVDEKQHSLLQFTASTQFNLFTVERNKILNIVKNSQGSELDKEIKASRLYLDELKKSNKKNHFTFSATVCVLGNAKTGCADIKLVRNNFSKSSNNFNGVIGYLKGGNFKRYMELTLFGAAASDKT